MSDHRISRLITTLVLMVCGRIAACAADNATYLGVPLWRRPMDGFVIMIR